MIEILPWSDVSAPALSDLGSRRWAHTGNTPACMFAHTVSWAVRHGIPVDRAVLAMPAFHKRHNRIPMAVLAHGPTFWRWVNPLPQWWSRRYFFSRRVADFANEVGRGAPLACAMRDTLDTILPAYYIAGVDRAEREGRIETAMPVLARQLELRTALAEETTAVSTELVTKAIAVVVLLTFIAQTLLPRFNIIFGELSGESEGSQVLFSPVVFDAMFKDMAWFFVILVLGAVLSVPVSLSSSGPMDWLLLRLPVVGYLRRRAILADTALGMAAFLRQGDDVTKAAEWCMASTRSPWMARRLTTFVEAVRKGQRWDEAWVAMRIGRPIHQWCIRNAAAMENPAAGFELLADWLRHEMDAFARRFRTWVDPIGTVALAAVVAWVAYTVFGTLVRIICGLM